MPGLLHGCSRKPIFFQPMEKKNLSMLYTCMSLFVSDLSVHQLFVCGKKDDDGGKHGNIIITE